MDRDTYDKKWKLGPYSKKKEELKAAGKLDKFGRVVDTTPEAWKLLFGDPEKPMAIENVVAQVKPEAKITEVNGVNGKKEDSDSDDENEKKRVKKDKTKKDKKDKTDKKDKKEKKDKKDKKKKAKDSSDESD